MRRNKEEIIQSIEQLDARHGITKKSIAEKVNIRPNYFYQALGEDGEFNDSLSLKLNSYLDENKHLLQDQPPPMNPTEAVQLLDVTGKLIPLNDKRTGVLPDYDMPAVEFFRRKNKATYFYRVEDLTMHPLFYPGDLLFLVEADTSIVISGELFLIEFVNDKTTIRYVHYAERDPNAFDLVPYNKSAGITPGVARTIIKRMFRIIHLSRQFESPTNNSVVAFQKEG